MGASKRSRLLLFMKGDVISKVSKHLPPGTRLQLSRS